MDNYIIIQPGPLETTASFLCSAVPCLKCKNLQRISDKTPKIQSLRRGFFYIPKN